MEHKGEFRGRPLLQVPERRTLLRQFLAKPLTGLRYFTSMLLQRDACEGKKKRKKENSEEDGRSKTEAEDGPKVNAFRYTHEVERARTRA